MRGKAAGVAEHAGSLVQGMIAIDLEGLAHSDFADIYPFKGSRRRVPQLSQLGDCKSSLTLSLVESWYWLHLMVLLVLTVRRYQNSTIRTDAFQFDIVGHCRPFSVLQLYNRAP